MGHIVHWEDIRRKNELLQYVRQYQSGIACANIEKWLDEGAGRYYIHIRGNVPLLITMEHRKAVVEKLQSQIKEYQDMVMMLEKRMEEVNKEEK
jgi:hypothetical protein